MYRRLICILLVLLVPAVAPAAAAASPQALFSAEQIDNLLAPVALYPDPLIAQVLPASTFVDQVDEAARYVRGISDTSKIDKKVQDQKWDVSVKAVAHYPQVLYVMADDLNWTTAVGQAYVSQSTDVMASIQRLRHRAYAAGTLATTPQQTVVVEQQTIRVVPAQPQVIYVPQYNPQVVYVEQDDDDVDTGTAVAAAAIAFGTGLAIGAWLNNDCDWHGGTVYYHGWHGTGWVSTSRTYVNVNNNVYVNRNYTNVNVNRTVVNRNVNYNSITSYNNVSRNVNYNNVNRARTARPAAPGANANRTVNNRVLANNVDANDARVDAARGRPARPQTQPESRPSTQPAGRPSSSSRAPQRSGGGLFGGGSRNRQEVQADSARGRASRTQAKAEPRSRPEPAARGRAASGGRERAGGGRKPR